LDLGSVRSGTTVITVIALIFVLQEDRVSCICGIVCLSVIPELEQQLLSSFHIVLTN